MLTRFLIIGDLHGQMPRIDVKGFDAVIGPGDFCSDALRSLFMRQGALALRNPAALRPWEEILGKQKAKAAVERSLRDGRRILARLNRLGVPVFIVPGNWDWTPDPSAAWPYLRRNHYARLVKGLDHVVDCYRRLALWRGVAFIGHGITAGPEVPQHQRERARYALGQLRILRRHYARQLAGMGRLFAAAKAHKAPVIFLSHNVPYNTTLDKITDAKSFRAGMHFGSLLARGLIVRHRPALCVGGHMHEHFGACVLGRTPVINAGFGRDVNVLLEMEGPRVLRLEFYRKGRRVRPTEWSPALPAS